MMVTRSLARSTLVSKVTMASSTTCPTARGCVALLPVPQDTFVAAELNSISKPPATAVPAQPDGLVGSLTVLLLLDGEKPSEAAPA